MDGVLDNIRNALETWSAKLAEIWNLLTQDPATFRGGTIWNIIQPIKYTTSYYDISEWYRCSDTNYTES